MQTLFLRRTLVVAALFAIAGCSGAASTSAISPAAQGLSRYVHHGVPFAPAAHRAAVARSVRPATYPTNKSLVFEGDQLQAAVNIYKTASLASNPAPITTIHVSAGCPYGMAMDKEGTLYVADNCGGSDVEEFSKGSTTESAAITDGISNPLGLAIDHAGNLYVSNYPGAVTVYPHGSTSPSETITGGGLTDPFGLALDKAGDLYIADFGADQVLEVKAGTTTVVSSGLGDLVEPIGVAINQKSGDIWVTDGEGDKVNVYHQGSTSPFESFAGLGNPYAISLENKGKPKATVVESDLGTDHVYAYKKGQYTPYADLSNGVSLPTGLLITKP
ncbi:MAG: hypothetical protein WA814_05275 [Candidatus Baltobacteraceae bacterium]